MRRTRSPPCTGNRNCSRHPIAGCESGLRRSSPNSDLHSPWCGNSGQPTGTFAQHRCRLPSIVSHSTSRHRSRTEPGRPARRGSTGDVQRNESCFDCAEARSKSPDCFLKVQTVSLRRSVQICVAEGLLHAVCRKRFAVDFDVGVDEEVQRLARLTRDQIHVAAR